jgi:hypothetical protein
MKGFKDVLDVYEVVLRVLPKINYKIGNWSYNCLTICSDLLMLTDVFDVCAICFDKRNLRSGVICFIDTKGLRSNIFHDINTWELSHKRVWMTMVQFSARGNFILLLYLDWLWGLLNLVSIGYSESKKLSMCLSKHHAMKTYGGVNV